MSESTSPSAAPVAATLYGRRILLGVCGGIAAYKAADLVRRLQDAGAEVQVVMTASAQRFVTAQTFQALSGRPVRSSLWDEAAEAAMGHIELARWPDLIVIAPASANTIARLAHGLADDLLSTLCLASDKPIAIAPAMNRLMWANPATQANLHTLNHRGVHQLGPGSGGQACGEVGEGRMWEPLQIRDAVANLLRPTGPLSNTRVVITAGPTREPIDPVRFITNRSSGKMGYALASSLTRLGAEVTLVSGPTTLPTPHGVQRIDVETAAQMLDATRSAIAGAQILVGTAAVADYRSDAPAEHKIKKQADQMALSLVRNPDILATLREADPKLFIVGFAAETEKLAEHAHGKLQRKKLDMIAANWVGAGRAFDQDDNALHVFWPGGERELPTASKVDLAGALAALIAERFHASRG
ncbi:bifunctional phosphopantothenoylcysteine decarboxylase/phosphopantothenate--cysteine ligase CoaBC [Sinimarinibacterium sp. CAU 1509]|uniref:bifunctional phosphopantothenoylcysteine decarboxylase/phosphopantothenate--cysteine ligase CoaBC n=1 Tax=Sinimarinibacterium sp. CAU 1509 TaxID=2562283 RepID=UPI0010AD8F00|nr:bifunctional phosphopantothenoylcysteine decarboxylase/phosphopantothenate--cysteine ligase CoaBC [Sinimarinibacterium sp. CAU 1509]TJY63200.1 bifunctional phosphopantothenoylcysteine decarboxylase/phosphopantothenate--cysteine ligase CoaBC [Sinimarinibacterium sp. CAU 1509]